MAPATPQKIDYPPLDGRQLAETDLHRDLMLDLILSLEDHFSNDPQVYISGNLPFYYVEGDKRKQVCPDVFVVRGVEKRRRESYLVWEEGRGPEVVIELTSQTTRKEDTGAKFRLYASELRVPEYFLFDPNGEYLEPPLSGYRLRGGKYTAIRPVAGRVPSKVLGLSLERDETQLRLYDPKTGNYLHSPRATAEQVRIAMERADLTELLLDSERRRADLAERLLNVERQRYEAVHQLAQAENERLRRELELLRHEQRKLT
jgi:Uma2 family endonuclease